MTAHSNLIKFRNGDVVLYKRNDSDRWQARFKTPDNKWQRISTKSNRLDDAERIACDAYDDARYRHKLGLIAVTRRFRDVAKLAIARMEEAIKVGRGKATFTDYIQVINKYLIPFFGSTNVDKIDIDKMERFDQWRKQLMKREPAASTMLNHNAALNRVFDTAISEGWLKQQQIPPFKVTGKKSERRPAFTPQEWNKITANLRHWVDKTHKERPRQLRELMWDYVLILANTGIRTGTEAYNLKWSQIRWHTDKNKERYLAITVSGKTGKRELVARHACYDYLKRIQSRFPDLAEMSFDDLIKAKIDQYVFRLRNGNRTENLTKTFHRFLEEYGLLNDSHGDARTLYSLRHMYATLRLSDGDVTIHQLAKQMGTSVAMLEKFYSHLEPIMIADKLAGKRYEPKPSKSSHKKPSKITTKAEKNIQ